MPADALVQLSCTFASAVAGEAAGAQGRYASLEDARSGATEVGSAAARAAVDDYASAVRLQAMTDSVWPPGAAPGTTQPAARAPQCLRILIPQMQMPNTLVLCIAGAALLASLW